MVSSGVGADFCTPHGAVHLSVPLVYLVRAATGGDPSSGASVQVDGERAEVRIWGAF